MQISWFCINNEQLIMSYNYAEPPKGQMCQVSFWDIISSEQDLFD